MYMFPVLVNFPMLAIGLTRIGMIYQDVMVSVRLLPYIMEMFVLQVGTIMDLVIGKTGKKLI